VELLFLESTKSDFNWIRKYYEEIFPAGASSALKQFDMMQELLIANPYLSRKKHGDVRALSIPKTPFSYWYRVTSTHIEILRIWDNRQQD